MPVSVFIYSITLGSYLNHHSKSSASNNSWYSIPKRWHYLLYLRMCLSRPAFDSCHMKNARGCIHICHLYIYFSSHKTCRDMHHYKLHFHHLNQEYRVGAGVGVARGRGNEPGVGAGVGVDQTASTPTLERFVGICEIICICMEGKTCMHILEIICTDIIFEFCRFTHTIIKHKRGSMTFKGESKRSKLGRPHPKCLRMAQNRIVLDITRKQSKVWL